MATLNGVLCLCAGHSLDREVELCLRLHRNVGGGRNSCGIQFRKHVNIGGLTRQSYQLND